MICLSSTRAMLKRELDLYPESNVQDLCKALYQSTFGPGHLISDVSAAADYLKKEAAQAAADRCPEEMEELDGGYVRVHLGILNRLPLSPDTFASVFSASARHPAGTMDDLKKRLCVLTDFLKEHDRLDPEGEAFLSSWEKAGYPAIHHSAHFRDLYHPAYRLLSQEHAVFLPMLARIDAAMARKDRILIAIDGRCASGKTTLAAFLKEIYDCNVVHMDDFFLQPHQRTSERYAEPGGNVDYERFSEEVLQSYRLSGTIQYRPFDCSSMSLTDPVSLPAKRLTVIEGTYSTHPFFGSPYDLDLQLSIDPDLQRSRIEKRNGSYAPVFFEKWIPLEEKYFSWKQSLEAAKSKEDSDVSL